MTRIDSGAAGEQTVSLAPRNPTADCTGIKSGTRLQKMCSYAKSTDLSHTRRYGFHTGTPGFNKY
jgi:hypothetical protein